MKATFKKLNNHAITKITAKHLLMNGGIIYNDIRRKYYLKVKELEGVIISHDGKHTFNIDVFDMYAGSWFRAYRKSEVKPKIKKCRLCKNICVSITKNNQFCYKCITERSNELFSFNQRKKEKREQLIKKHLMIFTEFHKGYELNKKNGDCVLCLSIFHNNLNRYFCDDCLKDAHKNLSAMKFIETLDRRKLELKLLREKESKEKLMSTQPEIKKMINESMSKANQTQTLEITEKKKFFKIRDDYIDIDKVHLNFSIREKSKDINGDPFILRLHKEHCDMYITKEQKEAFIKWIESHGVEVI